VSSRPPLPLPTAAVTLATTLFQHRRGSGSVTDRCPYQKGSAALRLAVERGLENVTIEDIAAEADVSPRTFGNYFSGKYEAICAIGTDRARRIGATLLARPADEPLWEAIVGAMLAHYEGAAQAPDGEWMARLKLVLAAPAIRGEYLPAPSRRDERPSSSADSHEQRARSYPRSRADLNGPALRYGYLRI
jgi:AcrR family transcriptional regulator